MRIGIIRFSDHGTVFLPLMAYLILLNLCVVTQHEMVLMKSVSYRMGWTYFDYKDSHYYDDQGALPLSVKAILFSDSKPIGAPLIIKVP